MKKLKLFFATLFLSIILLTSCDQYSNYRERVGKMTYTEKKSELNELQLQSLAVESSYMLGEINTESYNRAKKNIAKKISILKGN